jgi:hypothetical protein
MQVAVAQMPEAVDPVVPDLRQPPRRLAMKPGIAATGTEMSCDEIAPIRRLASGMVSRRVQNSARCASDWATRPSVTNPCLERLGKERLQRARRVVARAHPEVDQAHPFRRIVEGMAHLRPDLAQEIEAHPVHDLEGRQPRPHPRLRQPQKAQRRVGSGTTISAAPVVAGFGKSRSVAAVITPSVPSAPIRRWRRS